MRPAAVIIIEAAEAVELNNKDHAMWLELLRNGLQALQHICVSEEALGAHSGADEHAVRSDLSAGKRPVLPRHIGCCVGKLAVVVTVEKDGNAVLGKPAARTAVHAVAHCEHVDHLRVVFVVLPPPVVYPCEKLERSSLRSPKTVVAA